MPITGMPSTNNRLEVVQGNNRAEALIRYWSKYPNDPKGVKQYLKDNAQQLGLDASQIDNFKNPVLVNVLDVSDQQAIELGQYKASDLESGGIQRIEPLEAVRKSGDKIEAIIDLLTTAQDETLSLREVVRLNALSALKYMQRHKIISDTQYQSAFKDNKPTNDAIESLEEVITNFLFKGARADLNVMWDIVPHTTKMGIIKSLKHIVGKMD